MNTRRPRNQGIVTAVDCTRSRVMTCEAEAAAGVIANQKLRVFEVFVLVVYVVAGSTLDVVFDQRDSRILGCVRGGEGGHQCRRVVDLGLNAEWVRRLELRAEIARQRSGHLQSPNPYRLTDGHCAVMATQAQHALFADRGRRCRIWSGFDVQGVLLR